MSIKDLFSKKTVVSKGTASGSADAESHRFMLRKAEQDETFVPPVDFSTASNFIRFGSAEEYYESSVRRVYSSYPYDGSEAEKILYNLSSSYYDRYILDELYPKSTGYGILNPSGYGSSSKTSGYGLNASSDDYEYIFIGGGVRLAPKNQHDPNLDPDRIPLYKKFEYGTSYEEGTDKGSVFAFSSVSGSTIEFWLKKNSFDTASTEKEVILDLWNGELSSSSRYGRITLELFGGGSDPFRFTYQNGTVGVFQQSLHSSSFNASDVADGKWHHWAVSTVSKYENLTNYIELKLYKDGVVVNKQSVATTNTAGADVPIGNISGRLNGQIGALLASPSSSLGALGQEELKYAGKLSASIDEVRFWKRRVGSREIYNNWYHPIGGGANTDENRESLGLYYKFNEGITLTSSIDSTVLDYSGRVANGKWTGYTTQSRNTGSCFVSASVLAIEPPDPIIRYNHNSVKTLIYNLKLSGSRYDVENTSYMYDMVPFWMREEDNEIGDNNLRKIYQTLASYFDTLYLQIQALPDIKAKQYFTMDKKPYPFAKELLQHNGLIVPDLFIDQGVLEKFSDRDSENLKYENSMHDIKSRIYYNIYNNLKTIYESKGTEKSYRNMLRCFGIDDEIVKLNLYTDNGINYLTDKVKYSSHKTKFINHNHSFNFVGRVFNTSSAGNPKTFISGSGPLGSKREKNLAFTLETDVVVPEKIEVGFPGYFPTDFITSSVMGFHSASADDPSNFAWYGTDESNLQVHLVRPVQESKNAKFVLTNNAKTIFAESETFEDIYDNQRWALALRVYPNGYPFIGTVATASNPTYKVELYGVTHNLGDVKEEFTISTDIDYSQGSAMLSNTKRFYVGCEATDFTGLPHHYSDLKIAACRLWYDKLDDIVVKQHNLDASNYGHNKIHGNPSPYVSELENVHIPSAEVLAFNWDFQQVTSSDSGGNFVVEDFSSGITGSRYGWIDDVILRENRGRGYGYQASSKTMIDNDFIFSAKKELPEISFTSDGVFIKGDEEVFFSEDEDTTDSVFMFEKSMYQVISEEVFKTFSTVVEYSNLFMKPVDHYREEYKRLDHFKELYFERVQSDLDFEKFTNYFKFIDSAISTFIQQLHPAMAKFNEGISDVIESHILERPKYKRQFPFVHTKDVIPDGRIAGIRERIYNWREGHAPNYRENFDENDHCFWQKERAEKPADAIYPLNARLNELRQVIVSEADGKAKNLGTSEREIYQGSTYAIRSFSKQYKISYNEQPTVHGGTNYGHQKNRDFVLDHLKPHGAVGNNGVPQEVITIGVGEGLGILGVDDCEKFSDPYDTDDYSAKHTQKAEWNFFGSVGRYADGTGDQPKSDEVEQLYKVKGHSSFPFTLVSGTVDSGYNKKINDDYDKYVILTNLHSDTTTPSNDVPMQGPFAEAWVGGRQFRHVPMNRTDVNNRPVDTVSADIRARQSLTWASTSEEAVYGEAALDSALETNGFTISFWLKIENNQINQKTVFQIDPNPLNSSRYGIRCVVVTDHLEVYIRNTPDGYHAYRFPNIVPNQEWAHYIIQIDPSYNINAGTDFIRVYKNNTVIGTAQTSNGGGFSGHTDKTIVKNLKTFRVGDMGNPVYDSDNLYELRGGSLQDIAIWNKRLTSEDRGLLYNGGKSIWPHLAPSGSAIINWWLLGDEPALEGLYGSTLDARPSLVFQSTMGSEAQLNFPTASVISIREGKSGHVYHTINKLDDQYTRPEGYRIVVGDHPSEPTKDGALGMVGPDYGGPYPDTTRQMAVHYREERAKRPFNIKNIQYSTASAILGNYKEPYELVTAGGRSINNKRFVQLAEYSSSLTSPMGAILPMTTNQATLFGSVPFLSGNVFGGLTNITADTARIKRYERLGTHASGAFVYNSTRHFQGGNRASGKIIVSGSTILSYDTGSFVASGSAQDGSFATGHFIFNQPEYTTSEGNFVFTGSTIQGTQAKGAVTVGPMPTFTHSDGFVQLNKATTFGTRATGSINFATAMPTYTVSSGSFGVESAFVEPVAGTNGRFTVTGKTSYETAYTGSFQIQGPAKAATRTYATFVAKGVSTMSDAHRITISLEGYSRKIESQTGIAVSHSPDIVMNKHEEVKNVQLNETTVSDTSFSGFSVGNGITLSFWLKIPAGEIPLAGIQDLFRFRDSSGNESIKGYWGANSGRLLIYVFYSDHKYVSPRWTDKILDDGNWHHYVLTYDGVSDGSSTVPSNFKLYRDGVSQSVDAGISGFFENLTSAKTASDMRGVGDVLIGNTDMNMSFKDIAIWDSFLSNSEVTALYNSGNALDITAHSKAANLVSLYTMIDPSDSTSTIQDARSNNNDLTVGDSSKATFFVGGPYTGLAKTSNQMWNELAAELNTAFTNYTTTYTTKQTSGDSARFWIHKDTKGAVNQISVSIGSGHTTFNEDAPYIFDFASGVDEVASTLKHKDEITITSTAGDTFVLNTTRKERIAYPNVGASVLNTGQTYRKALHFGGTEGIYTTDAAPLSNTSFDIDWSNQWISVSGWAKRPNQTNTWKYLLEFNPVGSGEQISIRLYNNIWYLYHDTGTHWDSYQVYSTFTGIDVGEWFHFLHVIPRNSALNTPKFYINGVLKSLSGFDGDNESFSNTSNAGLYIGGTSGNLHGWGESIQDIAIWERELDAEDANVLINSGSWFNAASHTKAPYLRAWWLLGSEASLIGQASGSALSTGTAVTTIPATIGDEPLTVTDNTKVYVSDGIVQNYNNDITIFNNLKDLIVAGTTYATIPGNNNVSRTISGNTATFSLTRTSATALDSFSSATAGGFKSISGPSANGIDLARPSGGAIDGDKVRFNLPHPTADKYIEIDTLGVDSSNNYAISGDTVKVFSNANSNNVFWNRIATAANAHITTHTFTHMGSGVFDVDAKTGGTAGNITIHNNVGSSFSNFTGVSGGGPETNDGYGKGISLVSSAFSGKQIIVYVYDNLTTRLSSLAGGSYLEDGVWKKIDGDVHNYYVSSTGSTANSSGVNSTFWNRIKSALNDGINAVTSHTMTINIVDLGSTSRIELTGSRTIDSKHDFTVSGYNEGGHSGQSMFISLDNTINGFGVPQSSYLFPNNTFIIDGQEFAFGYPSNGYSVPAGHYAFEPTGSKTDLLNHMVGVFNNNIANFDFARDGDLIGLTGSAGGSDRNNKITSNAHLISSFNPTAGGTNEQGVGHSRGITMSLVGFSQSRTFYSLQTLASGSGTLISNGVMKDGSIYYISSTGSTGNKSNGVNADYWNRWKFALEHATNQVTSDPGKWYVSGSTNNATLYFTGSYALTNNHDLNFLSANGSGHMGSISLVGAGNVNGFGYPTNSDYYQTNGSLMQIQNAGGGMVNFENVYPFNGYQAFNATNVVIRHTGSQAAYVAALNTTMSHNLTNFTGFGVDAGTTRIGFTGSTVGSAHNFNITNRFQGMTTENITDGANQLGVVKYSTIHVRDRITNATLGRIIATDDLRNESGMVSNIEDGVWKHSSGYYYVSSTGSAVGSDGVQSEWVRRVMNSFAEIIKDSGEPELQSITIVSGSSPTYRHQLQFVGSLTASSGHDISFLPLGANLLHSSVASTGYGYFKDSSNNPVPAPQKVIFSNGLDADTLFHFTAPWNNFTVLAGHVGIRVTGSRNAIMNRISSSIKDTLTNYTITDFQDQGTSKKFTMSATSVGSVFNGDLSQAGNLLVDQPTATSQLQGGHLPYNQFDHKHILISMPNLGSDSKNHLFTLDHDAVQPVLTNKLHRFEVKGNSGAFYLNGELFTGSTYVGYGAGNYGKQQPDLILVRGSTYKFTQTPSNGNNGHPLVFHTEPLTASNAGVSGLINNVKYFNDGVETAYGSYVPGDNANDYVQIAINNSTPKTFYYGCGVHSNMGGKIYVIGPDEMTYVDSTGTNTQVWDRLRDAMKAQFSRLTISYSDSLADDQPITGDVRSDDYIPSVGRALFKFTGSQNSVTTDRAFIVATGSSWSDVHHVTGATTYGGEGIRPGAALSFNWGTHPDTGNNRIKIFGITGFNEEDPFDGNLQTEERTQVSFSSVFTGSALPSTIEADSAYYISSSAWWDALSASIMDIGQYTIVSTSSADNKKWKEFNITAKYYHQRFNFTGSSHPIVSVGFSTSSTSDGFNITRQMQGALNPATILGANNDSWFQFQLGSGESVRIRSDYTGWRDRTGDPARTVYFSPHSILGTVADRELEVRNNLSGAIRDLTSSLGISMYQINGNIQQSPAHTLLTASVTGSDFNFVAPATIVGNLFQSGSNGTLPFPHNYHGAQNITGAVDFIPRLYYSTRVNVNQTEQSTLVDGTRQKTTITSRFYGGGGPETMTEAFLDVYAKEKSVYSALPFRNLHVKNNSGEVERNVHSISEDYASETIETLPPSLLRVNSHANRREGLNTLHARHTGPAGLDSVYGTASNADFTEPVLGGTHEPSFHKIHRNAKIVPRLVSDSDTAAILVKKHNNFYLQSQIPASDYHYSWVTSSLGDNYSVDSGRQKVFGYWPKDGILIRNNKKGEAGSYYATQITASTIETAIVFPTGSDVHGS